MTDTGTGGCLCGAIRYLVALPLEDCGYCHCRMCQRASGAPVMAFGAVKMEDFEITEGDPVKRRSSAHGERWHCGACGSPIAMRTDDEPDTIDIAIVSLDNPEVCPPKFHIWTESRVPWFDVRDKLKRFARSRRE